MATWRPPCSSRSRPPPPWRPYSGVSAVYTCSTIVDLSRMFLGICMYRQPYEGRFRGHHGEKKVLCSEEEARRLSSRPSRSVKVRCEECICCFDCVDPCCVSHSSSTTMLSHIYYMTSAGHVTGVIDGSGAHLSLESRAACAVIPAGGSVCSPSKNSVFRTGAAASA